MKNQSGTSRMDTVLKMLLIAFISLLAFSSGVFFGKQLSDNDYQLKALESDFSHSGTAVAKNEGEDAGQESALAEEDVASISDKLINSEKQAQAAEAKGERTVASENEHATEHGDSHATAEKSESKSEVKTETKIEAKKADPKAEAKAHAEEKVAKLAKEAKADVAAVTKPAAKNEHAAANEHAAPKAAVAHEAHAAPAAAISKTASTKPDLSAVTKAAQRVASNAAADKAAPHAEPAKIETPAEPKGAASIAQSVGSQTNVEFTVQVASYPTADAAKSHAEELVKKGFPAFPVQANVNGKVWYRVSVGSFKTQKDATVYRSQLLKQANLESAIVQKIRR